MKESSSYKFFAFISYSRKDAAFAAKLQKFLEHFKLPAALCHKYPDKPKNLRPVYRDKTDLGIDKLTDALQMGLSLSKYLVVICSENSAKPNDKGKNWINEEVKRFVELDSRNVHRVIPVMIRDNANVSPDSCYPPYVKELGLSAIDALSIGVDKSLCSVVAKMLELEESELWKTWRQIEKRKQIVRYVALSIVSLLILFGGLFAWDYCVPKVSYYADYVELYNVAKGVNELTEEEILGRGSHYRFTEQYYKLRKVECCNSAGKLVDSWLNKHITQRPVVIEYTYGDDGVLEKCHHLDKSGNEYVTLEFPNSDTITFQKKNCLGKDAGSGTAASLLAMMIPEDYKDPSGSARKAVVKQKKVKRNENGAIVSERYYNAAGYPCYDSEGAAGCTMTLDSENRVISRRYVDGDGNIIATRKGVKGIDYTYDSEGNIDSLNPVSDSSFGHSFSQTRIRWKNGNPIEEATFGADGRRLKSPMGDAYKKCEYDDRGNLTLVSYYDTNNLPCSNILGYSSVKREYDSMGNEVSQSNYDPQGKPCMNVEENWAKVQSQYDTNGNVLKQSFYGVDGKPCMAVWGGAIVEYKYDDHNRIIEDIYRDENGQVVRRIICKYDSLGNATEIKAVGNDGKLMPCALWFGSAKIAIVYDFRGNQTEIRFYDANEKPFLFDGLCSGIKMKYDARGNLISQAKYGKNGELVACNGSYYSESFEYDEACHLVRKNYLDINGNLCSSGTSDVAAEVYENNSHGLPVKTSFLDEKGKPCLNEEGVAGWIAEYDAMRNLSKRVFFGIDGVSCNCNAGYAIERILTNLQKTEEHYFYFNAAHEPVENNGGAHKVVIRYNSDSTRIVDILYYGKGDGEKLPLIRAEVYGDNNKLSRAFNYLQEGPVAGIEELYDERGLCVESHFLNKEGKLIPGADGYAIIYREYDEGGVLQAHGYFDVDNKPFTDEIGCHFYVFTYDENGLFNLVQGYDSNKKLVCRKFWNNKPSSTEPGVWTTVTAQGKTICIEMMDVNLQPCVSEEHILGFNLLVTSVRYGEMYSNGGYKDMSFYNLQGGKEMLQEFDAKGTIKRCIVYANNERLGVEVLMNEDGSPSTIRYIDKNEKTCATAQGVAIIRRSNTKENGICDKETFYSLNDEILYSIEYDASGMPVKKNVPATENGAGYIEEFDSAGRVVRAIFVDKEGKVSSAKTGFAACINTYDARGFIKTRAFLDENEKPVSPEIGYAYQDFVCDDVGNIIEETYRYSDGSVCTWSDGTVKKRIFYHSDNKKKAREEFLDKDGKVIRTRDY